MSSVDKIDRCYCQLLVCPKSDSPVQYKGLFRGFGGLDSGGGGQGRSGRCLKKVGDVQGRFPEVNGRVCYRERRAREEKRNLTATNRYFPPPSFRKLFPVFGETAQSPTIFPCFSFWRTPFPPMSCFYDTN